MFIYKFEFLTILSLLSTNIFLALLVFNLCFSFCNLCVVSLESIEHYTVLSKSSNPMDLTNMLNPATASSSGGGNGPENPAIFVAPQQDSSKEGAVYPTQGEVEVIQSAFDYNQLGNKINHAVDEKLAERRQTVVDSPYNPSGKLSKISQGVTVGDISLTKEEKAALKQLSNTPDFPAEFAPFKNRINSRFPVGAMLHTVNIKYSLIDYIKGVK